MPSHLGVNEFSLCPQVLLTFLINVKNLLHKYSYIKLDFSHLLILFLAVQCQCQSHENLRIVGLRDREGIGLSESLRKPGSQERSKISYTSSQLLKVPLLSKL